MYYDSNRHQRRGGRLPLGCVRSLLPLVSPWSRKTFKNFIFLRIFNDNDFPSSVTVPILGVTQKVYCVQIRSSPRRIPVGRSSTFFSYHLISPWLIPFESNYQILTRLDKTPLRYNDRRLLTKVLEIPDFRSRLYENPESYRFSSPQLTRINGSISIRIEGFVLIIPFPKRERINRDICRPNRTTILVTDTNNCRHTEFYRSNRTFGTEQLESDEELVIRWFLVVKKKVWGVGVVDYWIPLVYCC